MKPALGHDEWADRADALRRMAHALVRDTHESEDLAQSACLTALENPPRRLSYSWLKRVLRSRVLDARRRNDTARERSLRAQHERTDPAADDIAQKLELHHSVVEAVGALDEPYRRVVYMRYFEDKGPAEIAHALGVPEKTVKTRLARALPTLRSRLARDFGGPQRLAALLGVELARPAAPLVSTAAALGGALLMVKKIAVVAVVAVAAWGVLQLRSSEPAAAHPEDGAQPKQDGGADLASAEPADTLTLTPDATARRQLAVQPEPTTEEPVAAPKNGTLIVHVKWHDGEPAGNVTVDVRTNERGRPYYGYARFTTNAAGVARASDLPVGTFRIVCGGAHEKADVVASEERRVDVEVPRGVDVEGRVVDAAGSGVSGARVWLSSGTTDWQGGSYVARADASGAFAVRSAPTDQSLGATAPGRAPSTLVDLDDHDTTQSPVSIELTLPDPATGCELTGRVLLHDEAPAAHAWITVGKVSRFFRQRNDGHIEAWTPRPALTDDQGRFELSGLAGGEHPVDVRAQGAPIWKGDVLLTRGANELEVRLHESARVVGVVRDAEGVPVAGAVLRAFDSELDESFVQSGQFDFHSTFGYPSAVADDTGRFVLDELPPGPAYLYASPRSTPRTGFESLMRDQTVLELTAGAEATWDPVLSEGNVLAGVVLFKDGEPMDNVFVSARNEQTGKKQSVNVGQDARFRFLNLDLVPYTLGVQVWDAPDGAPPIEAKHAMPGEGEIQLMATWNKPVQLPRSTVMGKFFDAAKRLEHESAIGFHLAADWGSFNTNANYSAGAFRYEDVKPGKYRLIVFSGENPIHWTEWFEVPPGTEHDVGTLTTEPGGALLLRLERGPGAERIEPTAWLRREGAPRSCTVAFGTDSERLVESLTVGEYSITVYGERMVTIRGAQATVPGEGVPTVNLRIERAAEQPLEIWFPEEEADGKVSVRLSDDQGRVYYEMNGVDPSRLARPFALNVPVPSGRFTIVAETDEGLRGEATFDVESLDDERDVVRVDVR